MAPVRTPWGVATLALVSVLHTSIAAHAQTQTRVPADAPRQGAPPPPGNPSGPAPSSPTPSSPQPGPSPEDAQVTVRERARAAFEAGRDAYAAQQYAAAEAHFALADSLLPAIQAKYWRAMSLDKLGNVPDAYQAFGQVLSLTDKNQLGPEKIAIAEARHRELAVTPADLTVTTSPAGARINVSGVDSSSRTPVRLRLAPGRHLLRVSLDGYQPQQLEIIATPGAKLTPSVTLVPAAPPPPPSLSAPPTGALDPSTPAERSRVPGYVTLGIAGASAVVGTIFGVRALSAKSDYEDAPTTSRADDVERNALIADMAFGVTLTLAITGIVLLLADDPAAEQASLPEVTQRASFRLLPYVAPASAGAAASLIF